MSRRDIEIEKRANYHPLCYEYCLLKIRERKRIVSAATVSGLQSDSTVTLIPLVDATGLVLCFRSLPDGHMTPYILSEWLMSLAHGDLEGPGRCPSK